MPSDRRALPNLITLAAAITLAGYTYNLAGAAGAGNPAGLAQSLGSQLRDLPEPGFARPAGPDGITQAQSIARSAGEKLRVWSPAPAPLNRADPQSSVLSSFAASLGTQLRDASNAGLLEQMPAERTIAQDAAAATATALEALAGLPSAPKNSTATRTASTPLALPSVPPPASAQNASAPTRGATTHPAPADVAKASSAKDDAALAQRAAELSDQANKAANDILRKLPTDEPGPATAPKEATAKPSTQSGQARPADLSAPSTAEVPRATVAPAKEAASLAIASARYLPETSGAGTLTLTGRGSADRPVALFLDETRLGSTTAGSNGEWRLETRIAVATGQHLVRAELAPEPGRPKQTAMLEFARSSPATPPAVNTGEAVAGSGPRQNSGPDSGTRVAVPAKTLPAARSVAAAKPQKVAVAGPARSAPSPARPAPVARAIICEHGHADHDAKTVRVTKLATVAHVRPKAPLSTAAPGKLAWIRVWRGKHLVVLHVPDGIAGAVAGGSSRP